MAMAREIESSGSLRGSFLGLGADGTLAFRFWPWGPLGMGTFSPFDDPSQESVSHHQNGNGRFNPKHCESGVDLLSHVGPYIRVITPSIPGKIETVTVPKMQRPMH